jgi:outer membrane lipopolysaccharide assembly protein LptE/RlpB
MKFKLLILFLLLSLLSSCGFKVVNNNIDYKIVKINTSGDKKINFFLKNKLSAKTKNENGKYINVNINSKKNKSIKEKNISNQITKYEIIINVNIEYIYLEKDLKDEFTLSMSGFYDVASRYSETLNNEKNLINYLIDELTEEIVSNLANKLNDI